MAVTQPYLNIEAWQERSVVNGPGTRFVLWLQGCPILCHGCFNEDLLPFVPRHSVDVEDVATKILAVAGIEGVTYSGGEPTVQAQGLALLSKRIVTRVLETEKRYRSNDQCGGWISGRVDNALSRGPGQ